MSRVVSSLALEGGQPEFVEPLHVGRPNQPPRDTFLRRVSEALDRNWITNNGPLVQEFEDRIAEVAGVRNCVAVSSGTAGLEVLMRSYGVSAKVAMPSFTFVATAAAASWLDIEPVLLDIEEHSFGLDPHAVDRLHENIGAIIGVHVWGLPCSIVELIAAADRASCPVFFDAAHAFGCTLDGQPIGSFGEAEVFSFHATKVVNTFEGGAVTTNDDGLASEIRRVINFGFRTYDDVVSLGTNAKMNEMAAAMGLASLDHMPLVIQRNGENQAAYEAGLADVPGLDLVIAPPMVQSNDHYIVVLVDEEEFGMGRDDLYRFLHSENVLARRYFYPGVHQMGPYKRFAGGRSFVHTEALAECCLALPTGLSMDSETVGRVVKLIALAQAESKRVRSLLVGQPLP